MVSKMQSVVWRFFPIDLAGTLATTWVN